MLISVPFSAELASAGDRISRGLAPLCIGLPRLFLCADIGGIAIAARIPMIATNDQQFDQGKPFCSLKLFTALYMIILLLFD